MQKRDYSGFSVCQFGADPTGKEDSTAQINEARRVAVQNNAALVFEGGTYLHDGDMTYVGGPESWRGESQRRPAIKVVGKKTPVLKISEYMQIENMRFIGDKTAGSVGLSTQDRAGRYNLRNVEINDFDTGADFENTWIGQFDNFHVLHCNVGLAIGELAFNLNFNGGEWKDCHHACRIRGGGAINFRGLAIEGNRAHGILMLGDSPIMKMNIKENYFERNGHADVHVAGSKAIQTSIIDNFFLPDTNSIVVSKGDATVIDRNYWHGTVSGGKSVQIVEGVNGATNTRVIEGGGTCGDQFNKIIPYVS